MRLHGTSAHDPHTADRQRGQNPESWTKPYTGDRTRHLYPYTHTGLAAAPRPSCEHLPRQWSSARVSNSNGGTKPDEASVVSPRCFCLNQVHCRSSAWHRVQLGGNHHARDQMPAIVVVAPRTHASQYSIARLPVFDERIADTERVLQMYK